MRPLGHDEDEVSECEAELGHDDHARSLVDRADVFQKRFLKPKIRSLYCWEPQAEVRLAQLLSSEVVGSIPAPATNCSDLLSVTTVTTVNKRVSKHRIWEACVWH